MYHARGACFKSYKDLYNRHVWEERVESTKPGGCCMYTSSATFPLTKALCISSWLIFQPCETTMEKTNRTITYLMTRLKFSE